MLLYHGTEHTIIIIQNILHILLEFFSIEIMQKVFKAKQGYGQSNISTPENGHPEEQCQWKG